MLQFQYVTFDANPLTYYTFKIYPHNLIFWAASLNEVSSLGVGNWLELYHISVL